MTYDPGLFGDTGTGDGTMPQDGGGGDFWSWLAGIPGAIGGAVGGIFGGGDGTDPNAAQDLPPVPGSEDKGAPIHYQSLGGGRILLTYADGTIEVKDFGTTGTTAAGGTAAATRVISLGGGRYLTIGPNGVEEKTFGGGAGGGGGGTAADNPLTPPSLEPGRSRIVAYLQALLGQNALPYNAVGGGPAAAQPAPTAAPVAAPALGAPALGPTAPTLVNVAGAPGPIDISGGPFALQPQNFLAALNPPQAAPRTFPSPFAPPPLAPVAPPPVLPPQTPVLTDQMVRRGERSRVPSLY